MDTIKEIISLADRLDKKGYFDEADAADEALGIQRVVEIIKNVFRAPEESIRAEKGAREGSYNFFIDSVVGILQPDGSFLVTEDEQFPGGKGLAQKFRDALQAVDISVT